MPSYIHVNICICIHTYNLTLHIYIIYTGGVMLRQLGRSLGDQEAQRWKGGHPPWGLWWVFD